MLTRFHKVLIAILAVQLVLVVVVALRGDDTGAMKEHTLLAGFDAAKVTRVQVLAGGTTKPIDIVKRDAGWVLASGFDYPVDPAKVTELVTPITKLSAAAPIATQASRHKQLKVADDDFERKLVITDNGKDVTLYVGGSAGARRTAVRIGGDDKVYGVTGVSAYTIGTEPHQWVDPSYVKVPRDEIAKLVVMRDGKTTELSRVAPPAPADTGSAGSGSAGSGSAVAPVVPPAPPAADHWDVTVGGAPLTLAAGESLDTTAIDSLLGEVSTVELASPADPKRDASKPTATITIERKASGSATPAPVVLDVIADGSSYWVHDRSQPRAVLVDKARLDGVLAADRDKLVKKPPPPPAPAQSSAPGAGSGSAAPHPGAGSPTKPGAGSAARPG